MDDLPFDLKGLFCHEYSTNSQRDLEQLRKIVRTAARKVRAKSLSHNDKGG